MLALATLRGLLTSFHSLISAMGARSQDMLRQTFDGEATALRLPQMLPFHAVDVAIRLEMAGLTRLTL